MTAKANGLLKRAGAIRALRFAASAGGNEAGDPLSRDSGITEAERLEIQASIAAATQRGKISGSAKAFVGLGARRGFLLPLLVNLGAIAITAGGLFALDFYLSKEEGGPAAARAAFTSAEGNLLREVQRDAASRLREKDLAIAEIQDRVADLGRQRRDLAAGVEARVAEREGELAAALAARLQEEREALRSQGLDEAAIAARLEESRASLEREGAARLAEFQREVESERAAAEAALVRLQGEYESSIADLGAERQRIQDEAKGREEALRASMDQRARELESQGEEARSALAQARGELATLSRAASEARAAEDRIVGLYGAIRLSLADRRFTDAVESAAALSAYLAEPSVASLPALQARRPVDLFVAEILAKLAARELQGASIDTARLLDQAESLARAREAAQAAEAARRAGKLAEAEARFREALDLLPGLLSTYDWFLEKARAEEARRLEILGIELAAARSAREASLVEAGAVRESAQAEMARLRADAEAAAREEELRLAEVRSGAEAAASSAAAEIAELRARLATEASLSEAEKKRLSEAAASGQAALAAAESRIAELLVEIEALRLSSASAALRSGGVAPRSARALLSSDVAELQRQVAELAAAGERLAGMKEAYVGFTARIAQSGGDPTAELESLRRFFDDPRLGSLFAGLAPALDRIIAKATSLAAADGVENAAYVAASAFGIADSEARARFLNDQAKVYASEPFMAAFIEALAKIRD